VYRISAKPIHVAMGRTWKDKLRTLRRKAWVQWVRSDSFEMMVRNEWRAMFLDERGLHPSRLKRFG
jgi:hypothetical protein